MGGRHPESSERLDAIEDRLIACGLADFLEKRQADAASNDMLAIAHSPAYISWLQNEHEALLQEIATGGAAYRYIDSDTRINPYSLQAARRAAGLAIAATQAVFSGELENAFCATRPPGHHAKREHGSGFCIFNNVALAALYALNILGLERIAIVDFDLHHGDGTESIFAGDQRALMVGFFQHGAFPYEDDVLGSTCSYVSPSGNMLNIPIERYTKGDMVQEVVRTQWLPALDKFAPQMIFISAGFDAHCEDDMSQLGLLESDYAWITSQIVHIAKRHAKGRIVSCLEGGYDLSALGRNVGVHLRALMGG